MFIDRYPYTDNQQLNLDWILKKIIELSKALNVSYDNTSSGLTASNVQEALDELNDLIGQIAQTASAFTLIDNSIAESAYVLGQSFNHLQTVNNPTLMEIINAMREDKYIDLRRSQTILGNDVVDNFIMTNVEYNPGIFCHKLTLKDVYGSRITTIKIYGLNDDQNVYVEIEPDVTITHVNSFNSRVGDVLPAAHDYDADQVDYDNSGSGLTATDAQAAIDEVNAKAGVTSFHSRTGAVQPAAHDYDADQVDYDNSGSGLTATDVQAAIDEVAGALPGTVVNSFNSRTGTVTPAAGDYDADQIDYDNSVSGITATDVQAAIDEIVNLVLSSGVASFNSRTGAVLPAAHDYDADQVDYDNSGSGLMATDVQAAIDEVKSDIPTAATQISYDNSGSGLVATQVQQAIDVLNSSAVQILDQAVTSLGSVIVNRMGILTINTPSLCPEPGITVYGYICFGGASQKILIVVRLGNNDTWIAAASDGYTFNNWTKLN